MNKNIFDLTSDKSSKILGNITFVIRCAFYAAVFVLLLGISQELIAIRFTLESVNSAIKASVQAK